MTQYVLEYRVPLYVTVELNDKTGSIRISRVTVDDTATLEAPDLLDANGEFLADPEAVGDDAARLHQLHEAISDGAADWPAWQFG